MNNREHFRKPCSSFSENAAGIFWPYLDRLDHYSVETRSAHVCLFPNLMNETKLRNLYIGRECKCVIRPIDCQLIVDLTRQTRGAEEE